MDSILVLPNQAGYPCKYYINPGSMKGGLVVSCLLKISHNVLLRLGKKNVSGVSSVGLTIISDDRPTLILVSIHPLSTDWAVVI